MELPTEGVNIFNSVINDIHSIQSRYENMLVALNNRMRKTTSEQQRMMIHLHTVQDQLEQSQKNEKDMQDKMLMFKQENDTLRETNQVLTIQNTQYEDEIRQLKESIKSMEEDRRAFVKVSHVVAIEKENARLRQEIDVLLTKSVPAKETVTEPALVNEKKTVEREPPQALLEVNEKKIKGIIYFVSKEDDRTIYKKNEDDSIGDAVGYLEKVGDKFKVSWYT